MEKFDRVREGFKKQYPQKKDYEQVVEKYVGLGSDFDGVAVLPVGLEDVSAFPKITEEPQRRGYGQGILKIVSGNFFRVLERNELVAAGPQAVKAAK